MPLWFFLVARALHIVFGGFWLGSAITVGFFLVPSVRDAGPAGGAVMRQIAQIRRMPDIILWSSWVALLAGAVMYWHASGGLQPEWMRSASGLTFGIGGVLGLAAELVALTVTMPAAAGLTAVGMQVQQRGGPPTPEEATQMQVQQRRMLRGAQAIAVLLLLVVIAMAIGDYG